MTSAPVAAQLETVEYTLLALLRQAPCHGYALTQALAPTTELGQMIRLRPAQLYFYLHKFERAGWIVPIDATVTGRHIVYQLTATGTNLLDSWLIAPVTRPRDVRLSFLVKLYFTQQIAPQRVTTLIDEQHAALTRYLAQLDSTLMAASADQHFFADVVVPLRASQTRAALDWLATLPTLLTPPEANS